MKDLRKYLAEFIGTFVLVLVACGTAIATKCSVENTAGYLATAAAFGLVIVAMAYSIGNISGCHINPAVSLAFFLRGELSLADFLGYICSQFIGGILGATLLGCFVRDFRVLGGNQVMMVNNNGDQDAWSYIGGFLVEVILTFVFVLVILAGNSHLVTMREPFQVLAWFPFGNREPGIEEKVEFLYPNTKNAGKKVMSKFMDHHKNTQCENQFKGFYPKSCAHYLLFSNLYFFISYIIYKFVCWTQLITIFI